MSKKVALSCERCDSRNYTVPARKDVTVRIVIKKYCAHCNEHTVHKQTL